MFAWTNFCVIFLITDVLSEKVYFDLQKLLYRKVAVAEGDDVEISNDQSVKWSYCLKECQSSQHVLKDLLTSDTLRFTANKTTSGTYYIQYTDSGFSENFEMLTRVLIKLKSPAYYEPTFNDFVQVETTSSCQNVMTKNAVPMSYSPTPQIYCVNKRIIRFSFIDFNQYGIYQDGDAQFVFTAVKDLINIPLADMVRANGILFPSTTLKVSVTTDIRDKIEWRIMNRIITNDTSQQIYTDENNELMVKYWVPEDGVVKYRSQPNQLEYQLNILPLYETHKIVMANDVIYENSYIEFKCIPYLDDIEFLVLYVNRELVTMKKFSKQPLVHRMLVPENTADLTVRCDILSRFNEKKRYNTTEVIRQVHVMLKPNLTKNQFTVYPNRTIRLDLSDMGMNLQKSKWIINKIPTNLFNNSIMFQSNASDGEYLIEEESDKQSQNKIRIKVLPKVTIDGEFFGQLYLDYFSRSKISCKAEHKNLKQVCLREEMCQAGTMTALIELRSIEIFDKRSGRYHCTVHYEEGGEVMRYDKTFTVIFHKMQNSKTYVIGDKLLLKTSPVFPQNSSWAQFTDGSKIDPIDLKTVTKDGDLIVTVGSKAQTPLRMSRNKYRYDVEWIAPGIEHEMQASVEFSVGGVPVGQPILTQCIITRRGKAVLKNVQWYKYDDTNIHTSILPNQMSADFFLEKSTLLDSGDYVCEVTYEVDNEIMIMTQNATVKVIGYELVPFTKSQYVMRKLLTHPLTLHCDVRRNGVDVRMDWTVDGKPVESHLTLKQEKYYQVLTSTIVTSAPVLPLYQYTCVAHGPNSLQSQSVAVRVVDEPELIFKHKFISNSEQQFTCQARGFFDKLEMHNNQQLITEKSGKNVGEQSVTLNLPINEKRYNITCAVIQTTDSGVYRKESYKTP